MRHDQETVSPSTALVPARSIRSLERTKTTDGEIINVRAVKVPRYQNYVKRTADGPWYFKRMIAGKLIFKSTGFTDIEKARRVGNKIERDARETKEGWKPTKAWTVAEWLKRYDETYTEAKGSELTKQAERFILGSFGDSFGPRPLDSFDGETCQQYVNDMVKDGYAPSTVKAYLAKISMVFRRAVKNGHIKENPWLDLALPDIEEEVGSVLALADEPALLAKLEAETARLVSTILGSGLRRSEVFGIEARDIDGDVIDVRKEIAKYRKPRRIPITPELVAILTAQRQARGLSAKSREPLFTDPDVHYRRYKNASLLLGYDDLTYHALRRTYATRLADANIPPKALMTLMGHTDIRITMGFYVKVNEADLRRHVLAVLGKGVGTTMGTPQPKA